MLRASCWTNEIHGNEQLEHFAKIIANCSWTWELLNFDTRIHASLLLSPLSS